MSAMIGSRPVVGSSKKMISGSAAMARARPTRFCMPPDNSDGDKNATSSAQADLGQLLDGDIAGLGLRGTCRAPWIKPEGDIFPHRQAVEQGARPGTACRIFALPCRAPRRRLMCVMSSPSTRIVPSSGRMMPKMDLMVTDLPVPEPPMITSDDPGAITRSTPSSTTLEPKRFFTPRSSIFGVMRCETGQR